MEAALAASLVMVVVQMVGMAEVMVEHEGTVMEGAVMALAWMAGKVTAVEDTVAVVRAVVAWEEVGLEMGAWAVMVARLVTAAGTMADPQAPAVMKVGMSVADAVETVECQVRHKATQSCQPCISRCCSSSTSGTHSRSYPRSTARMDTSLQGLDGHRRA